jgi:hypothetical protein
MIVFAEMALDFVYSFTNKKLRKREGEKERRREREKDRKTQR